MFSLLTVLATTLGPAGLASLFKMLAGWIDRKGAEGEAREKREMIREMRMRKADIDFQKAVFGNDDGGLYARTTRRILAVIGMVNLSYVTYKCLEDPTVPLLTFIQSSQRPSVRLLWGAADIPTNYETVAMITTGHLVLMNVALLSAIVGFYFTPGGRTK